MNANGRTILVESNRLFREGLKHLLAGTRFEVGAEFNTLEQAIDKEPANAEINDHLGDAYWAVGRQREAGFQWNRVLTLEVDDKRRGEVEAKLRDRLNQNPTGDHGLGSDD